MEGWDVSVHDISLRAVAGFFAAGLLYGGAALAQTAPDASAPIQLHPPTIQLHPPARKSSSHRHKRTTAPASGPQATAEPSMPAQSDALVPYSSSTLPGAPPAPSPANASQRKSTSAKSQPVAAASKARAAKSDGAASLMPPSPAERRKAVEAALVAPAAQTDSTGFSFDLAPAPPKPAPPKAPVVKKQVSVSAPAKAMRAVTAVRKSTTTASLETPPVKTALPLPPQKPAARPNDHAGLTKQGEILFPHADADPQSDSAEQLKTLAAALNSALDSGSGRVELDAYGGSPGDKSSEARRLSLRRALATRQLLIDGGVPANRIDVRALGGIDDHGNSDRVDIFLSGASGG